MSNNYDDASSKTSRDRGGSDDEDCEYHFLELEDRDEEAEDGKKDNSDNNSVSYRGLYVGLFLLLVSLCLFARSMLKKGHVSLLWPSITLDKDNMINVYDQFSIPTFSMQIKKYTIGDLNQFGYFKKASGRILRISECSDTHIGANAGKGGRKGKKFQRSNKHDNDSISESNNQLDSKKTKLWMNRDEENKDDAQEDRKEVNGDARYDYTALHHHQDQTLSGAYSQYRNASLVVSALTLHDILPDVFTNNTDANQNNTTIHSSSNNEQEEAEGKRGKHVYQALHAVSRQRYPKVLSNALPLWWNSTSWSLWTLSRKFPVLQEVYILANTSQYNQPQQTPPDISRPLLFPEDVVAIVQMSYLELLQSAQTNVAITSNGNESSDENNSNRVTSALFFTCHYNDLQNEASSMLPLAWQHFQIFDFDENSAVFLKERGIVLNNTQPQYWTLTTGAMQLKYSHYHRVLVQLSGTVEFVLFAPDSDHHKTSNGGSNSGKSSSLHAMRWHSALSHWDKISSEDLYRLPALSEGKKRYTTLLEPGQVLYIPPFWAVYAQVQKGIPSVLEVPSISMEQLILAEAEYLKIPWHQIVTGMNGKTPVGDDVSADQDQRGCHKEKKDAETGGENDRPISIKKRVIVAQVMLLHVLSRVKSIHTEITSPKSFGELLLSARMLNGHEELSWKNESSVFMDASSSTGNTGQRRHDNKFTCYDGEKDFKSRSIGRFNQQLLVEHASFIASALEDVVIPVSSRILWLYGFTERLVQWVVDPTSSKDGLLEGEAFRDMMRHVIAFSEQCLDMTAYIFIEEEEEGPKSIILDPSEDH